MYETSPKFFFNNQLLRSEGPRGKLRRARGASFGGPEGQASEGPRGKLRRALGASAQSFTLW